MARRYAEELAELPGTYQAIRALGSENLTDVVRIQAEFNGRDAYFVGSGGAIAMAQLAASVHALGSIHVSRAVTPLNLAMGRAMRVANVNVGLFSARARHPDVLLAARAVRAQPGNRVVLLTQLAASDLDARLVATVDEIVTLPRTTKDGFLATNSILAMAGSWLRAAGFDLPATLPMLAGEAPQWPRAATRALVLYGPDQVAAAYDLEARLSETGLIDVQLADLRNMAHGRHVGLLSRANSTAVVTLGDPGSQPLVQKTIAVLPPSIPVIDLSTKFAGPVGTLDALAACMRLTGDIGAKYGVDPGKPGVSPVGRKLYHLPWSQLATGPNGSRPVRLKTVAAGMTDANAADLDAWTKAWEAWIGKVTGREIRAIVVDYDGTCVPTQRRTSPPSADVQAQIFRLLEFGMPVAVASGRGPSVIDELRLWIPQEYWANVLVGLYNGGVIKPLTESVERRSRPTDVLDQASRLLTERLVGTGWNVSARRWQITVERIGTAVADAAASVAALLGSAVGPELKVVESGHSVDVVPSSTSKRAVVDHLGIDPSNVLLIGDQGGVGGNDFELLSYSDLSLSVDRVSADGSRCWNLSADGTSGPELLAQYLQAVDAGERRAKFVWRPSKPRGAK